MRIGILAISAPLALVLVAASMAGPERAPADAQQAVDTVVVNIRLGPGGDPIAVPDPVRVDTGQVVVWESNLPAWEVKIPSLDEPIGPGGRTGIRGRPGDRQGGRIRTNARQDINYKYSISVFTGNQVRTKDPEIDVGPG
jgi:hypothetical protein